MKTPTRIKTTAKPKTMEDLGTGYWYYNYDIRESLERVQLHMDDEETEEVTMYSYLPVRMFGKPEYRTCAEAVIRLHISQNEEFDLINTAKRVELGLITEPEANEELEKYKAFLQQVDDIKAKIRKDFPE